MKCPECAGWTDIKDTRQNKERTVVTRRRQCANGHLFTTHEKQVKTRKERDERRV